jgi:hypothetical protein
MQLVEASCDQLAHCIRHVLVLASSGTTTLAIITTLVIITALTNNLNTTATATAATAAAMLALTSVCRPLAIIQHGQQLWKQRRCILPYPRHRMNSRLLSCRHATLAMPTMPNPSATYAYTHAVCRVQ